MKERIILKNQVNFIYYMIYGYPFAKQIKIDLS